MHQLLVVDVADGAAAGRQAAILGQGDHAFGLVTQGLGPGLGGGDPALTDQLGGEPPEHRFALVGGASQHGDSALVSHGTGLVGGVSGNGGAAQALVRLWGRVMPMRSSASITSSADLEPKFLISSRSS